MQQQQPLGSPDTAISSAIPVAWPPPFDWPTQQEASAPPPRSMLCAARPSFLAPPPLITGLSPPPHHPCASDASRELAQGATLTTFTFIIGASHNMRAHSTTPLYHHLGIPTFNQRLFFFWSFLSLLSNDIDIKCYDISAHLGFRKDFFLPVQL
jgi:hypothetical protein